MPHAAIRKAHNTPSSPEPLCEGCAKPLAPWCERRCEACEAAAQGTKTAGSQGVSL